MSRSVRGPSSCVTRSCGAGAHPLLDVVAGDDEILAVVGAAAHDDVDVGIVGVPVIDADPIELGAEILLHLAHQLAGEAPRSAISAASSGETMKRK